MSTQSLTFLDERRIHHGLPKRRDVPNVRHGWRSAIVKLAISERWNQPSPMKSFLIVALAASIASCSTSNLSEQDQTVLDRYFDDSLRKYCDISVETLHFKTDVIGSFLTGFDHDRDVFEDGERTYLLFFPIEDYEGPRSLYSAVVTSPVRREISGWTAIGTFNCDGKTNNVAFLVKDVGTPNGGHSTHDNMMNPAVRRHIDSLFQMNGCCGCPPRLASYDA